MEEKERFEYAIHYILDTETNEYLALEEVIDLLNQQDKRIKELEEENKVGDFWHSAYQGKQLEYDQVYAELRNAYEENQELKQSLENLQKLNGEIITLNRTVTKDSQILEKENEQLKQSQKQLAIEELETVKNCKECPFIIDRGECNSRLCFEENFVNCDCKLNSSIGYIGITKPHNCPLEKDPFNLCIDELQKIKTKFNGKRPIDELACESGIELGYTSTQIGNFIENRIKKLRELKTVTNEYANSTEAECLDDLNELTEDLSWQYQLDDLDKLMSKAQNIQSICERLKELKGEK